MQITTLPQALERIDYLEAQVDGLQRELGHILSADVATRLVSRWKLTPKEALILAHLTAIRGRLATKDSIMSAIYRGADDEPEIKIVDVFICKLRNKIGEGRIATVWGQGYRLTPAGLAEVDAVLNCELAVLETIPERPARIKSAAHVRQAAILAALKKHGPLDISTLTQKVPAIAGMTPHRVRNILSDARKRGRAKAVDWQVGQDGLRRIIVDVTTIGVSYVRLHAPELLDIPA